MKAKAIVVRIAGVAVAFAGAVALMGATTPPGCVPVPVCEFDCGVADPVCGVDGVTYWCGEPEASCNGVEVAFPGECGLSCTSDADCGPGFLCELPDDCFVLMVGCMEEGGGAVDTGCLIPPECEGVCRPVPDSCTSDAECGAGEFCVIDWCDAPVYAEDGDDRDLCFATEDGAVRCDVPSPCYGHCEPVPERLCASDADCGGGAFCAIDWCEEPDYLEGAADRDDTCFIDENGEIFCGDPRCYGHCEPLPEPGCTSDADCGIGAYCQIDWCEDVVYAEDGSLFCDPTLESDGWCEPFCYGHCEPLPAPECFSDGECAPGYHCSTSDGECRSPCDPSDPSLDCIAVCAGICVPDGIPECVTDWDCPAGYHCSTSDGDCRSLCEGTGDDTLCIDVCAGICLFDPALPEG